MSNLTVPPFPSVQQIYTIFVGDLSLFCNESKIQEAFSEFGEILSIRIAFDEDSQKQLPYGFVDYASLESATAAMQKMDGHILCGRRIRVKWATNKRKDDPNGAVTNVVSSPTTYAENYNTSSVHVIYLSYQCDVLITEETLRTVFSKYGDVQDVMIKKSSTNKENGMQKGYGFVHYSNTPEGIKATLSAVEDLFDATIDNVNYTCSISHTYEKKLTSTAVATADTAARISSYMGCVETLLRNKIEFNGKSPPVDSFLRGDTYRQSGQLRRGANSGTGVFVADSQRGQNVIRARTWPTDPQQQLYQQQPYSQMYNGPSQQQGYPMMPMSGEVSGGYYPTGYDTAAYQPQPHGPQGAYQGRGGNHAEGQHQRNYTPSQVPLTSAQPMVWAQGSYSSSGYPMPTAQPPAQMLYHQQHMPQPVIMPQPQQPFYNQYSSVPVLAAGGGGGHDQDHFQQQQYSQGYRAGGFAHSSVRPQQQPQYVSTGGGYLATGMSAR